MNLSKAMSRLFVALSILGMSAMAQDPPKPSEEHKVLAAEVGTWDASIKAFTPGSNDPMESKGTEVNEMMPGGLWIFSKFDGEFGGMKFQGRGTFGYDPVKQKYVGTWVDSMNPTISMLEGSYDAKTKTLTYSGEGVDPETKSKYSQRMVTTMKDDSTRIFTLYMKFDKDEMKMMEITYKKRK